MAQANGKASYDYDLVVVGGGSGGLAAAKEAIKQNPKLRIALFDFVVPTQHKTSWGLGGTCVNVGCIPKKLFHHAATLGYYMDHHAEQFGWENLDKKQHNWDTMRGLVQDYIKSLNFSYRTSLQGVNIKYFNAFASFDSAHTLNYFTVARDGTRTTNKISFEQALIASGGRPTLGDTLGRELAVTSDDIFQVKGRPGKTLVVGAGYISLETASFLHHLGNDVTVVIRGEILRKMDRQSGQMIGELMERDGVRFIVPATLKQLRKVNKDTGKYYEPPQGAQLAEGKKDVYELVDKKTDKTRVFWHPSGAVETHNIETNVSTWEIPKGKILVDYNYHDEKGVQVRTEEFDTVVLAIGRTANTRSLNLASTGVRLIGGKILVDQAEKTTASNIWALGDVATGIPEHTATVAALKDDDIEAFASERPELTPVAISAGILWAKRLFGNSKQLMQYQYIPTSVFTSPSEYAFVGLSEEQARRTPEQGGIGEKNVKVYWSRYGNIEISPLHPHYVEPRSRAFLGRNLWARRFTDKHHFDWAEASFDTELNADVTYRAVEIDNPVNATVKAKHINEKTHEVTYDIEREDNKQLVSGVFGAQLDFPLGSQTEQDNSELFIKANCLAKLIVDTSNNEKVIGLHFLGPNAGEVVQGFALAVQMGATKHNFDNLVGIHPTAAEEFAVLDVVQGTGKTPLKKAGCGGGSCG